MPLSERRLAMLREIGVAVWQRPGSREAPPPVEPGEPPQAATQRPAAPVVAAPGPPPGLRSAPDERARRVATLDWPALREEVASCQACALGASRTQAVFGSGSVRAQWLIVGEAPGEQEDLRGEPFVGAAGKLLDAMLRAAGLTRSDEGSADAARQVYIANTLKCRPPRNRNPEPGEMQQCEPFLARQIELLRPRVILAMGRFAVQSLLRTEEPIGRLRGRVHACQGVPVVVTYHPAYLLRNLPDKAKAWDDLCLALQAFEAAGSAPQPGAAA